MQMLCFMANLALITIIHRAVSSRRRIIFECHILWPVRFESPNQIKSPFTCRPLKETAYANPMRANQKQLEPKTVVTKQFYK